MLHVLASSIVIRAQAMSLGLVILKSVEERGPYSQYSGWHDAALLSLLPDVAHYFDFSSFLTLKN